MKQSPRLWAVSCTLALMACSPLAEAAPFISEIMFHPAHAERSPEPVAQEWFELYNPGPALDVSGWRVDRGIDFVFPAGTMMSTNGCLVVAADVTAFRAAYPGFRGAVVGGWTGRLSNKGERLRLRDANATTIDEVTYADSGDWATRSRQAVDQYGHAGWEWTNPADGLGHSIEKQVVTLPFTHGRNWKPGPQSGGTPGVLGGGAVDGETVFISDVTARPVIPRSTDPIEITARIDDASTGSSAQGWRVRWRLDGATVFQSTPMETLSQETLSMAGGTVARSLVRGMIPPQADRAIVEFYVEAQGTGGRATWPPPARTSAPGVEPVVFQQAANCLLQVDNSFDPAAVRDPAAQPVYRFILKAAELTELRSLQASSSRSWSGATMNASFVAFDGNGLSARWQCGVRNRGYSSRVGPPNNYHLAFPADAPWQGHGSFQFNCRYPHSQSLGAAIFGLAGLPVQEAAPVQVRLNGINYGVPGTGNNFNAAMTYGSYSRTESLGGDWVDRHYPLDSGGNLYRVDDHERGNSSPSDRFRYPGTDNPDIYDNIYLKETNEDLDDYTDLASLFFALNNTPDQDFVATISTKINLDQWLTYFAVDALIGNMEGGLGTGRTDDFSMYRGEDDRRFVLIPHDFDTVMGYGDITTGSTRNIFSYVTSGSGIAGLQKFFNDPEIVRAYYAKLLDMLDTVFTRQRLDPVIDQLLAGWVPANVTQVAKNFIDLRQTNVLGQIQREYAIAPNFGSTLDGMPVAPRANSPVRGTFHVGNTRSVLVNGQPAQLFYRTSGTNAAGTWQITPAATSGFWKSGLNRLSVVFYDGPNGTGAVLATRTLDVWYAPTQQMSGVSAEGVPLGSTLHLETPASYVPGVPFLVKVERRNVLGEVDRSVWSEEVSLSASQGVALRAAGGGEARVTLTNGRGSLLVTAGSADLTVETLIEHGGRISAPNPNAALWKYLDYGGAPPAAWKSDLLFDVSGWRPEGLAGAPGEFGGGDEDERTLVAGVPTSSRPVNPRFTWYFRHAFDVADVAKYQNLNLRFICDDGMAVYLNGTEIHRFNLAANAGHDTPALTSISGNPAEITFVSQQIPATALVNGRNLIAAELHNAMTGTSTVSEDLGFDLEFQGLLRLVDPGHFQLTLSQGGNNITRSMRSLGESPESTTVSGTVVGDVTWQGVVRVTGDVTVPAGSTLTIAPGTHVLMTGTSGVGDALGSDLIVQGALRVEGTAEQPVSITAALPETYWGEILVGNGATAEVRYAMISRGAHSPSRGHTGTGPVIRLSSGALVLEDSVVADFPGKAVYTSGSSALTIRRSHLARMVTGPEATDGCTVLIEDSHFTDALPHFREGAEEDPDDEDTLYIHNGSGQSVRVKGTVLARAGDDVIDCLGGPIVIEDCIIRDGWDKGISLLNNDLAISRSVIAGCDKAIAAKSSTAASREIEVAHCTIIGGEHDTTRGPWGYNIAPSRPDPDTPSVGLYTQNKSGQSNTASAICFKVRDSIIVATHPVLVDAPYPAANTEVRYSLFYGIDGAPAPAWPGEGNVSAEPLLVNQNGGAAIDLRLQATSPALNAGDPASPPDPDGSRADMGAFPFGGFPMPVPENLVWSTAFSPYHVTRDLTIPAGTTLTIEPGVSVYFDQNRRLTTNGVLRVLGTAEAKVVFSHVPGTVAEGDADPITPGVQTGPAKWGGIRLVDSWSPKNIIQHAIFLNAQGTSPTGTENEGSLGIIRSQVLCDHLSFSGTRMRQLYARSSTITVQNSVFPAPFAVDEDPAAFGLNGGAEAIKIEYPTDDPAMQGWNVDGFPRFGWCRVLNNTFHGNSGRNDVVSAESGRQKMATVGRHVILDCRGNHFHGPVGASHLRVFGDALISRNVFHHATKDPWSRNARHASAISATGRHEKTTAMVAANVFYEVDHAIELTAGAGAFFEYNTVANINPDYTYTSAEPEAVSQQIKTSVIHLYTPELPPAPGAGAYLEHNIVSNAPRLFSGADEGFLGYGNARSEIRLDRNFFHAIADESIGPKHTEGIFLGGLNVSGDPMFVDAAAGDFRLSQGSAARGMAWGGNDYGATVPDLVLHYSPPDVYASPEGAMDILFGGPGLAAFHYQIDNGPWVDPTQRTGNTTTWLEINYVIFPARRLFGAVTASELPPGTHTLRLRGKDFAGNWLEEEMVVRKALVFPDVPWVLLSEIVVDAADGVDWVELRNTGGVAVDLGGWGLGNRADGPLITFAPGLMLDTHDYLVVPSTTSGLRSNKDGDSVYLFQNGVVRDSVTFGPQIRGYSIARLGTSLAWGLAVPTPKSYYNNPARVAGPSELRISEWFASSEVRFENDWIELHNPSPLPVALEGVAVTDNRAGLPRASVFPPLSFIGPGSYLLLQADDEPDLGPLHLPFKLDQLQDRISILAPDGAEIDGLAFYGQTADMSQSVNGAGYSIFHELPTAGFAMAASDPAYQRALAIQRGLRITEIMYNAAGGNDYDWVELSNVGFVPLSLAGVAFVEGIEYVFGDITLAPGQSVVVVANEGAFRARYGSAPVVAGVYSGRLDNGGETLRLQLPAPFASGILDFRYEDFWFPETDGAGRSLELADHAASAAAFADRSAWRASAQVGGSPGTGAAVIVTDYPSWKRYFRVSENVPDADGDGLPLLLEYALDTDPGLASFHDGPGALPELVSATPDQQTLRLVLPVDTSLAQGHGRPDVRYEIQAAETLGAWTTLAAKTPAEAWSGPASVSLAAPEDGWQTVTITSTTTPPGAFRFFRLRVAYQP